MSELKRMTSNARSAFIALFALWDMCDQLEPEFKPLIETRAGQRGMKRFKLAERLLEKVCNDLMETIPTDQLRQIQTQVEHQQVRFVWKGPVQRNENGMWVLSVDEITMLARMAVDTHCLICDKTLGEPCQLRKLLDDLPIQIMDDGLLMSCRKGI